MEESQLRFSKILSFRSTAGSLLPGNIFPTKKSSQNQKFSDSADRYLNEYMQNLTEKGIQILGSDVKIERSESHWKIHGH